MERLELEVSKREVTGKKVKLLRREGITPANLYGHGIDSTALQVDAKRLKQILAEAGKTALISLKIDHQKTPRKVLVREVQRNPLTEELLHVDFYQVRLTEKIKAEIPLVFVGEAPALKIKNTSVLHLIDTLTIEALPDHLPHNFEVDLSSLIDTNVAIHVKDIPLGERITLLSDPEQMVVRVVEARREEIVEVVEAKVEEEVEGVAEEGEAEAVPSAQEEE